MTPYLFCFLKCSKTYLQHLRSCFNARSVSLSTRREPVLPAPQANLCPDEATTGTSLTKRSASSLMFRDALKSRSCTTPHCWHIHSLSSSVKSCLIQPHAWQVLLEGYHLSTS